MVSNNDFKYGHILTNRFRSIYIHNYHKRSWLIKMKHILLRLLHVKPCETRKLFVNQLFESLGLHHLIYIYIYFFCIRPLLYSNRPCNVVSTLFSYSNKPCRQLNTQCRSRKKMCGKCLRRFRPQLTCCGGFCN